MNDNKPFVIRKILNKKIIKKESRNNISISKSNSEIPTSILKQASIGSVNGQKSSVNRHAAVDNKFHQNSQYSTTISQVSAKHA